MTEHHDESAGSGTAAQVAAIEQLLVDSGVITEAEVARRQELLERHAGPLLGARAVARAWVDTSFRARLLEDANTAMSELGIELTTSELVAVANSAQVHNVVVCTLCSCYPVDVLGLAPAWYKSNEYRARMVREPLAVLREFGLALENDVEIRVWDSSSVMRYIVVPERPAGTDGMSEDELTPFVTRDAMIGVAR